MHDLIKFFSVVGPVAYARMAGDASQVARFAFVEFANAATCHKALQLNGSVLGDRPLKYVTRMQIDATQVFNYTCQN